MIWAAVDVLDGQCVQLQGGDPATARFSQDPLAAARHWVEEGADGLHLVDLNAALGKGDNARLVENIVAEADVPVQVGGGIRDLADIEAWLDRGVDRVIVGTKGINDPDWLLKASERFSKKIVLAVDARGDEITVKGWTEGSGKNLFALAEAVDALPLAGLLYTNVGIEGAMTGLDPTPVLKLCTATRLPVLVSGGLKDAEDVLGAYQLGAAGVVLGTALYEGKIRLKNLNAVLTDQYRKTPDQAIERSAPMPDDGWAIVQRKTKETDIVLKLKLQGEGRSNLELEPYFLRHMLDSFAVHGRFNLDVRASGEDDHHLIEDVGLCLGQAIRKGLFDMKIARIAHAVVPMDEALVLAAVDLVDRPYARVSLPDPMYEHFMRSMALDGAFTLHVRPLAGEDVHHVVEAGFKALGRALAQAVQPVDGVSSTKGEVFKK